MPESRVDLAAPTWSPPAGPVTGFDAGDVWRATGIRYALADRFRPPRRVPAWQEPLEATAPSPACPQAPFEAIDSLLEESSPMPDSDEDCLRVSVTVPAGTAPDAALPVMVWIHGGSYVTGAGDLAIYDPSDLVREQQVVVVNVTYRLGLFGYLPRPGISGNLGLLDQRAALQWVHDNIAAFGGDPGNVTVFGESAGGDSVAHLMLCTTGLMRRAIIQSAPFGVMHKRSRMYRALAARAADLPHDASVDDILTATKRLERFALRFGPKGAMPFGPAYGEDPLPAEGDLAAAWARVAPDIEVLVGHTFSEGSLFVPPPVRRVRVVGPTLQDRLAARLTAKIYADEARAFAERHHNAGGRAGYFVVTSGRSGGAPYAGAHTTDLPLLLGSRASWDPIVRQSGRAWAVDEQDAQTVRAIWAGFARDGHLAARDAEPITVRPLGD